MLRFLSSVLFSMAVSFCCGLCCPGDATALLQTLPNSVHSLVYSLSDVDREVLFYMLAFGVYLQMLTEAAAPAFKILCKPLTGKLRCTTGFCNCRNILRLSLESDSKKVLSHKPSLACFCFSCYSSVWHRWTVLPHRDDLNKILEVVETEEMEVGSRLCRAKATRRKKKIQDKKRVNEKECPAIKSKGLEWRLHSMPPSAGGMVEASSDVHIDDVFGCPSIGDDLTPLHVIDGADTKSAHRFIRDADKLPRRKEMDVAVTNHSNPFDLIMSCEAPSLLQPATIREGKQHERSALPSSSPGVLGTTEGKSNLKHQCILKRKSNQITPLNCVESSPKDGEEREVYFSNEDMECSVSPQQMYANLRGGAFLSHFFPDFLSDIASQLWYLVSKSRSPSVG